MALRFALALAAVLLPAAIFSAAAPAAGTQFDAALKTMPAQSDKFRSMMSNLTVAQFHFVSVAGQIDGAALRKNAAAIADLRDTLGHTTLTDNEGVVTSLRRVLTSKNLTIDRIVGVYVGGNQITLYYQ